MSSLNDETLGHDTDLATSVTNASVDAIESLPTANNSTSRYNNCPPQQCFYNRDGNVCLEFITCGSAPEHFRALHSIRDMARDVKIVCQWHGCGRQVQRHNFMRHLREVHLGHGRTNDYQNGDLLSQGE
ncbi:hypothetical protein EDD15DRAFT_2367149 [Pisolithus albus]|nr:hypothetical protein EDD15DRAFT_2367149 [Pisolithus albus]